MNVLFFTSWYPTLLQPYFGVFIKEHAHAIHLAGHNIVVLALLVSKKKCLFQIKVEKNKDEAGVRTVVVQINGKLRGKLSVVRGSSEQKILSLIKQDNQIINYNIKIAKANDPTKNPENRGRGLCAMFRLSSACGQVLDYLKN